MSTERIIRAWRNAEYRDDLTAETRAGLPEHPAGPISLEDAELDRVAGGVVRTVVTFCTPKGTRGHCCSIGFAP